MKGPVRIAIYTLGCGAPQITGRCMTIYLVTDGQCIWSIHLANGFEIVFQPEVFPTLENDGHITVQPQEIMKCAKAEFVSLAGLRVGEKVENLRFANLITDGLSG